MCEIEKSLSEIGKSPYEKLKLPYENEKLSCEIIITNRERKTTIRDFILTVENEKSLYEEKNHHSRISISFFLSR